MHTLEQLPVQKLISHPAIKTLTKAVFPRILGLDIHRYHTCVLQPFPYSFCNKLSAVVAAKIFRYAV